jgi:hypothetical protein
MSPTALVLGFLPVVLYGVVVDRAGAASVPVAALAAFAVAAALVVSARLRGRSAKLLTTASAVLFAGYAATALVAPSTEHFLGDHGRSLAPLVLAAVIFATLPVLPFTEQFAREQVPAQVAADRRLRALNRRLSAVWGVVVLGLGVGHALATALAGDVGRPAELVIRWGLPAVLLVTALRYTERVTSGARSRHARTAA